jgi:ATP-dependent phosphoenolpyruvate carboxykinase
MAILDSVLRGSLEDWVLSDRTGLVVPSALRTVDTILVRPEKLYSHADFERQQQTLDRQRAEYMDAFPDLHPQIKAVFQKALQPV